MSGRVRTLLLMLTLTGLLMLVAFGVSYALGMNLVYALTLAVVLAVILNFATYWYADRWVLRIYKARIVSEKEDPRLHRMVERLARNAGIPKPKVAIVPVETPNAFATGRSPSKSVVAVTAGARELLDEEELEGVLGHEITHIKNWDMLINTIAAVIGAVVVYLLWFSMFAGSGRDRGGGASILLLLGLLVMPFAMVLIRMAISRAREYSADEGGARISRKPLALASALRKLEAAARRTPLKQGNPSTSQMFIVNPFRNVSLVNLLASHPPTEERIRRLEEIGRSGAF